MSVSACSRRLSGSIRPRVPSVTPSGSQSSGLRPSYTVSSVDALLRDLLARPGVQEAITVSQEALGPRDGVTTPAALRKASAYVTIGRAPPPRRGFQNDIDENIAETTFRRHPTDGALLWRPSFPTGSLRSSMHVLAQGTPPLNLSLSSSSSQPLPSASPQHAELPHTGGPSSGSGSLLLGLFDCSALGLQGQAAQGQAQAQTGGRAPPAVSLTDLSPLSPQPPPPLPPLLPPTPIPTPPSSLSLPTHTTLEPCAPQRIKLEASEETSVHAVAPTSDTPMSSAPSVRACPLSPTPSAMKAGIAPPSIPLPPAGIPLVSPLATPSHLSPLMGGLPSPSVFQSPLTSPGLAPPPAPHPSAACKPESPIARTRRAARTPPMLVRSTPAQHTLAVRLPEGLAPEMVTISAKKGARLAVVADLWHREDDSHYEWEVVFSPADVDMMSVRAVFEADGQLMIHVRRRPAAAAAVPGGTEAFPPPLVCSR